MKFTISISFYAILAITGVIQAITQQQVPPVEQAQIPLAQIRQRAEKAVVNIIAQQIPFDWSAPYKIADSDQVSGSGFFINSNGDILTNYHVVEQATQLWIQLPPLGQEKIAASVKSACPERDLALLQLSEEGRQRIISALGSISYLELGNSDIVKRGDTVMGFGYPLGQSNLKISTGVISGPEYEWDRPWLQTTAPLNGGNSGGPILNGAGEVIGIASAVVEKAKNIGYAVPINEFKLIASEFETSRLIREPFIGLEFYPTENDFARMVGNPVPGGVYVRSVLPGSLAQRLGIHPGDALYGLNGYMFDTLGQASVPWRSDKLPIAEIIHRLPKNKEVPVVFYRNGRRHEKKLFVTDLEPQPIRKMYPEFEPIDYETIGGLVIMQLTDNYIDTTTKGLKGYLCNSTKDGHDFNDSVKYLLRYDLSENKHTPVLVVPTIIPGSLAGKDQGIRAADRIKQINGKNVSTLAHVRTAVRESLKTGYLTFKSHRGVLMVLPLQQALADEQRLSKKLNYKITPAVQELLSKGLLSLS